MADTVGAAQLAITADASGVEAGVSKAKRTLATLGGAAKAAGAEASKGVDSIGKSSEQSSQKIDRSTKHAIAAIQRQTAAFEAGSRSSSKYWESVATQRGIDVNALKPYLAQLDAASAKQAAAAAAAKVVAPAITQVGLSAKQTAFALRGVPAQFTDIATSLAAGQNPMQVFLQQGGQLKDMFGGIGPAARALGGYVLGLVNPFTLAAAAVGVLGLAYFQGSREGDAFAKAVILSGNAAGKTVGQLQQMAERISDVSGTQSAAAAALAEVVQSGQIAGDRIERFTAIALKMEKETGQAVSETVKQFVELGKSPVEASSKLNEATNFLTASVAQQIRTLEEQGRVADAARVAQEAYAGSLETRLGSITQRLGYIERGWRSIVGAAKDAWDAMLNVGRASTLEDEIKKIQDRIEAAQKERAMTGDYGRQGIDKGVAILREQLNLLTEQQRMMKRGAEARAADAEQGKARLAFDKAGDRFLTKKARMEREITEARNQGAAAGAKQEEIDRRIAGIREEYADKGAGRAALRLGRAEVGLDIEKIRGEAEQLVGAYTSSERRIETLRSAGILSDREYYESKKAFINLESAAKEGSLQKEIARYQAEKLTGAEKLQNDKKIADAQAKLAILRADTSSKLEENSERQIQATRAEAAEFKAAQLAAEDYFQSMQRRQDMELSGVGKGRRQRDLDRGEFDIGERFGSERRGLANRRAQQEILGTFTEDERRRYEERLRILDQYEQRELESWQQHNERKLEAEMNWLNGAQEALQNYADQSENVAGRVEELFGNAFGSMEDALAQFIQTGKLNFSSFVRSILANAARLAASNAASGITRALVGAVLGAVAGGSTVSTGTASGADMDAFYGDYSANGRAIGGPVSAGGMYEVNERGHPELLNVGGKQFLMMGSQSGNVTPAGGGGGNITIVNNTSAQIGKVTEQRVSSTERALILEEAVLAVAGQMGDPNSRVSRSMSRNFTVRRNR